MISGRRGTHWTKRGSTDRGETLPTARRGGGRGGTPSFPAKGRRTRGSSVRTSTSKVWGVDFRTWFGRRGDDADCQRRGQSRAAPVRGGSGCGKSGEGDGRGWTGLGCGARGGGGEALGQRNRSGVVWVGRISGGKRVAALRCYGSPGGGKGKTTEGGARLGLIGQARLHWKKDKEEGKSTRLGTEWGGGAGGPARAAWRPLGASARREGRGDGQRGYCKRWEEEQRDAWSGAQKGAEPQGGAQAERRRRHVTEEKQGRKRGR
jgi:hypothetical protein